LSPASVGFSVGMPTDPDELVEELPAPASGARAVAHLYRAMSYDEKITYMATYVELPGAPTGGSALTDLVDGVRRAVRAHGRIVVDEADQLGEHRGFRLRYIEHDGTESEERWHHSGARFFSVRIRYPSGRRPASADRFLRSFAIER